MKMWNPYMNFRSWLQSCTKCHVMLLRLRVANCNHAQWPKPTETIVPIATATEWRQRKYFIAVTWIGPFFCSEWNRIMGRCERCVLSGESNSQKAYTMKSGRINVGYIKILWFVDLFVIFQQIIKNINLVNSYIWSIPCRDNKKGMMKSF